MSTTSKSYKALELMYASHVLDGKRTLESVPISLRATVEEIVLDEKIKEKGKEEQENDD